MAVQKLRSGGYKDRGQVREINEDDFFYVTAESGIDPAALEKHGALFIVADGVGGNRGGQQASHLAVTRTPQYFYAGENEDPLMNMRMALDGAARDIINEGSRNPELANMACTVVAVAVKNGQATIGHLGDARAYLMRNGKLRPLTKDHTWVQEQVDAGTLTPEEARKHPNRNVITKSLGNSMMPAPTLHQIETREGDRLMLCSDGLCGVATDQELAAILGRNRKMEAAAQDLVNLANSKGGPDNIAVVTAQLGGPSMVIAPAPVADKSRAPLYLGLLALLAIAIGAFAYLNSQSTSASTPTPEGDTVADVSGDEGGVLTPFPSGSKTIVPPTSTLAADIMISATGTITATETITTAHVISNLDNNDGLIATPTLAATAAGHASGYPTGQATTIIEKRKGPGINYSSLGRTEDGERFDVIAKPSSGEWYLVEFLDGGRAWLAAKYVEFVDTTYTAVQIPLAETIPPTPIVLTAPLQPTSSDTATPAKPAEAIKVEIAAPKCGKKTNFRPNAPILFRWAIVEGSPSPDDTFRITISSGKVYEQAANGDSSFLGNTGDFHQDGQSGYEWDLSLVTSNDQEIPLGTGCIGMTGSGGGSHANPTAPPLNG